MGNTDHPQSADRQVRFIPTRVGNTPDQNATPSVGRFIPTRVGNTLSDCMRIVAIRGSSPREWGTLTRRQSYLSIAVHPHASGEHALRWCNHAVIPVHPHASGEHVDASCGSTMTAGSSPREWGTLAAQMHDLRLNPVHPHARGEHADGTDRCHRALGSSPREWGTRWLSSMPGLASRGSSPRAWGTLSVEQQPVRRCGSSPRAWGTRRGNRSIVASLRFIPTRVGNTLPDDIAA